MKYAIASVLLFIDSLFRLIDSLAQHLGHPYVANPARDNITIGFIAFWAAALLWERYKESRSAEPVVRA